MRDILQSRYLRRRVAHKQLARTSLISRIRFKTYIVIEHESHVTFFFSYFPYKAFVVMCDGWVTGGVGYRFALTIVGNKKIKGRLAESRRNETEITKSVRFADGFFALKSRSAFSLTKTVSLYSKDKSLCSG